MENLYKLRNSIRELLESSQEYKEIQTIVESANKNADSIAAKIKENNCWYENANNFEFSFVKESLINSCQYEIRMDFVINGEKKNAHFGLDTLIMFLNGESNI